MRRQLLPLLLPALLVAACGQTPAPVPSAAAPGATTPGTPAQQALPGVFQIDFNGVGTNTPTTRVQSLHPGGLAAQGLVSAPDQFSFSTVNVQTFATPDTGIRHIRVTYKVTNTSTQTLRNPKFVAVVPQGSTTGSVFTNARYFDGTDASATIDKLSLVQGQRFDTYRGYVEDDPDASAFFTGLDVSQVDITGKGIKTLTQTGWQLILPPQFGSDQRSLLAPGDSTLVTFGVNVPMTSAADGGARKDPFSFSLNVTAVQNEPLVFLSSVVKQWDAARKTFGNYIKFPTQTYMENGAAVTRSLPAYYDIEDPYDLNITRVVCAGDANMSVTNISTADFPNRWRVQLLSPGDHTLKVFEAKSCAAGETPLVSQTVSGVRPRGSSLTATESHSLAVKTDGTVQGWGTLFYGRAGTRPNAGQMPFTVGGLSGIVGIEGSYYHNLMLKADGTVQSWGFNHYGQLGDGSTTDRFTPITVSGLSGITSIGAGLKFSLALKADGTVWSWGGDSTDLNYSTQPSSDTASLPATVSGLSDIVSIAAARDHSLALRADGTVLGWGNNEFGQLGDGTYDSRSTPDAIFRLTSVTGIAAGGSHSLALMPDGTVESWGLDATDRPRSIPTTVAGLSGVTNIAAGATHDLALQMDGTVWTWGSNAYGELGDGTTTRRMMPARVGGLQGITGIAAGPFISLALQADGTVQSWGHNNYGQLGDGTTTDRSTPGTVTGLSGVMQPTP